jgi:hypothetical protein
VQKRKTEKSFKLAKLACKETMIIYGRNADGEPDQCFEEGKEYIFCVDEKKGSIFTFNDVKEAHFLSLYDSYTYKYFNVMAIGDAHEFGLDLFTLERMKRLNREKHDFEE